MNLLEALLSFCLFLSKMVIVSRTMALYVLQFFIKLLISYRSEENFLELVLQSGQDLTFMGFSFFIISILTDSSNFHVSVNAILQDNPTLPGRTWLNFVIIIALILYVVLSILAVIFNRIRKDSKDSDRIFMGRVSKKWFFALLCNLTGFLALTLSLQTL